MNELGYQRLILKSVIEHGGAGWKCSNRFLIGIPDLLLQVPHYGTSLCEVKMASWTGYSDKMIKFKVTKLQWDTLRDWEKAGGVGGVIVIATRDKEAYIAAFQTRTIGDTIIRVPSYMFSKLERGRRETVILNEIERRIYHVPSV